MRRDGWRGWCKSRRKALVKLNSLEPRVSVNSIPEMEVIIITSGSGWRLSQLWLVPLWLFGVLLFSRDAPTESTTTATSNAKRLGPKQPRRRNRANCAQATKKSRTSLEAETALSLFGLKQPRIPSDLGRNSLDADTQLGLASPRSSSCLANPPRTSLRSPRCLTTCLLALTCLLGYLRFCLLAYLLTYLLT